MDLNVVWFILIAVLFSGFFFLEGFDFGVGILQLFLGENDEERRILINTIGPFWDGNEVWLITAGGAIFAAFPIWYSTMFSGFYIPLLIVLVALILRGVAFEFRSKEENLKWRGNWDKTIFVSSLFLAFLWGIALANLIKGIPIDKSMNFAGSFSDLISIYTLSAGLATFFVFLYHGSIFLSLRTTGNLEQKALKISSRIGICTAAVSALLILLTFIQTDLFKSGIALSGAVLALLMIAASNIMVIKKKAVLAFLANGIAIILGVAALFSGLYPRVMVSSLSTEYDLTIYNAASGAYTLSLMSKVALIFVPLILAYQGWTYWVFRKRVGSRDVEY